MINILLAIVVTLSLSLSIVSLLINLDIIIINKPKTDKYEKYRNEYGLLGKRKE